VSNLSTNSTANQH